MTNKKTFHGLPVYDVRMARVVPHAGPGRILSRVKESIQNEGLKNPLVVTLEPVSDYLESLIDKSLAQYVEGLSEDEMVYVVWVGNNRWHALRDLGATHADVALAPDRTTAAELESPSRAGFEHLYE